MKAVRWLAALALGLIFMTGAYAQEEQPLRYCGVQMGRSAWLVKYQAAPHAYPKGPDTILYIPLTIHIVGNDNGAGYYAMNSLIRAMCRLNEDFAQANIQFFIEGEVRYINNSAYYNHETVLEGATMMFAENVPNTLNCYFVNDPAGNCGYNLPYAGIAMRKTCAGPNDHTWAHEIGHALKLPHPFLGWEGGVSWDGSVSHNFSNPAPPRVTYDYTFFKDTLILDTLIIDTAYVELVDGSNCAIAADGFCDTSPDYIAARWTCDGNGLSGTLQHDPNGVGFRSNGSYIMGYANDACQAIFTEEQKDAMRAYLLDQRSNWLYDQTPATPVSDAPAQIVAPAPGDTPPANAVYLAWTAAEGATHYLVEVSRLASFSAAVTSEYIAEGPFLQLPDALLEERTYFWRVKPFNRYRHCADYILSSSFITGALVGTQAPEGLDFWTMAPNPAPQTGELQLILQLDGAQTRDWEVRLTDALGRQLLRQPIKATPGRQSLSLSLPNGLAAGLYFIALSETNGPGRSTKKLLVQ